VDLGVWSAPPEHPSLHGVVGSAFQGRVGEVDDFVKAGFLFERPNVEHPLLCFEVRPRAKALIDRVVGGGRRSSLAQGELDAQQAMTRG
jgi:hypothetical protein